MCEVIVKRLLEKLGNQSLTNGNNSGIYTNNTLNVNVLHYITVLLRIISSNF